MTPQQFRAYLRKQCNGHQSKLAWKLEISPAYISDILRGVKEPGPKVLSALGFERIITYKRIKDLTGIR